MAAIAALAAARRAIDSIPLSGVQNGNFVVNTAMPASSHVRARARWVLKGVLNADPVEPDLADAICWASRADMDANARTALAADEKIDIGLSVALALARAAAWRYFGMTPGSIWAAEVEVLPHADAVMVIHADHVQAVVDGVAFWSGLSTRMPGILWYNSISFETCNHHHMPDVTKRLATTTITLLGLKEFFAANVAIAAEGLIMHDTYHPVAHDIKSTLARNKAWSDALTGLGFDNLRKRVPIKASDCAIAINYPVLLAKARTYAHSAKDLPTELNVPGELATAIQAYEGAADAAAVRVAVDELRAMSAHLMEASVYVAGFMLGRDRRASDDEDMTLKLAAKNNTILGSPAYKRGAGEFPGAWNAGLTAGWAKPTKAETAAAKDLVSKRVKLGMALAVHARATVRRARDPDEPDPGAVPTGERGWFGFA